MHNSYIDNYSSPIRNSYDFQRNKSGIFTSAGRAIANKDDPIQHNFVYKPPHETKKIEKEQYERERLQQFQKEADFLGMAKANPVAFNAYQKNLDKLNQHTAKVEAYTNKVQEAKEKRYQDQRNVEGLQQLNRLNSDNHRQFLQDQVKKLREPVTHKNFAYVRDHSNKRQQQQQSNFNRYISDAEFDVQNDLLDQYAASNSLADHLSPQRFGAKSRAKLNELNLGNLNYGNDQSFSNPLSNRSRNDPYQYNTQPNVPQFNPQQQPQFNPYQQPQPQPYYGGSYPQPMNYSFVQPSYPPPQQDNHELKYYLQKQNDLLENITKRIDNRERSSRGRQRLDSRAIDNKFKDYEKETELRLKMMKQQQMIESLQNQSMSHNQSQQQPKQNDPANPLTLAQNFMQYMNPFQYGDNFANPFFTPQYNPYGGYGYPGYDPYAYGYGYNTPHHHPHSYSHSHSHSKKRYKDQDRRKKKRKDDESGSEEESEGSADSREKSRKRKDSSRRKSTKLKRPDNKKKLQEEEEEERKRQEEKKLKAKANIRKIGWSMVYPTMFDNTISKRVVLRRQAQQKEVDEKFDALVQNCATWMMNVTQDGFTPLLEDKKSYDFVGLDFRKLSKSDLTKRVNDCKAKVKSLLEHLLNKTEQNPLDNSTLGLLTELYYDPVYASDKVLSNYEMMRIKFNYFGRIMDKSKVVSQMMIACLMIVRILVYQLIFKASEWNEKYKNKWNDQLLANFKITASVIYRLTYSIWEADLPVLNPNPSNLIPTKIAPLSFDANPLPENADDPEMITGVLTKNQLSPLLDEDKEWNDNIKKLIVDWTEKIYKQLEEYRKQNPPKKYGDENGAKK